MQWKLIQLRKDRGYSQKDMADYLKINITSYGAKERGQQQFTTDELFEIMDLFKLSFEDIFLPRDFIENAINNKWFYLK